MSDLWNQAQTAIAGGDARQAHVHLARLLQKEPQNEEAWYLLSTIVPSTEQRKTFLNKVLKINPEHPLAADDLRGLEVEVESVEVQEPGMADQEAPSLIVTEEDIQELDEDDIPPWIDDDDMMAPISPLDDQADEEAEDQEEIPEWLADAPGPGWDEPEEMETIVEEAAISPPAPKPAAKPAASSATGAKLTPVLVALILAAVVVFILMVIAIINVTGLV
jgi:hypothetical protein